MTPDELKTIRGKLGLSQQELASLIGASVHALRKWEQGQRKVSGVAAVAIKKLMEGKKMNCPKCDNSNITVTVGSFDKYDCSDCGEQFPSDLTWDDFSPCQQGAGHVGEAVWGDDGYPYCNKCGGRV